MPTDVREEREASVVTWAGWDASMLDALLDGDTGPPAIGFALARALGNRLLPSPAARFCFRLYRYCRVDGTYLFVGAWNETCLRDGAVPASEEALERRESATPPPDAATAGDGFHDDEIFLPLETGDGVLGFGVLRIDSEHEPTRISPHDLHFLGRLAGAALSRLDESDRTVRMHRSFESASRHLDAVLDLTSEAILLVDIDGVVRIANESALRLLGRTGRQLLGQKLSGALPSEAAESTYRVFQRAEEEGGRVSAEVLLTHEGGLRPFELTVLQLQPDIEIDPTLLVRFRPASSSDHAGRRAGDAASTPGRAVWRDGSWPTEGEGDDSSSETERVEMDERGRRGREV